MSAIENAASATPKSMAKLATIREAHSAASRRQLLQEEELPAPLAIEPASKWAEREPPPPRDWIIQDLAIAAGRVTSFLGNGGFGKTMVATQIAVSVATNRSLFGLDVSGGPVVGIFCEDEQDDIERRGRAACAADNIELSDLDRLFALSRDGEQNLLCAFHHEQIILTDFYHELDATLASLKPRLTILDTAADIFGGDFMSTPHVRQFIKVALGGLCKRHETAVLLLAHPSQSGIASGDGGGFSVAWHNSVRSRLFLRKPKSEDEQATADRRVLEVKKSNYGPVGAAFPLIFDSGRFALDPEPIAEGKPQRAAKVDTALSIAIVQFFNTEAPNGSVLPFGRIFEHLQRTGAVEKGHFDTIRKRVGRALRSLCDAGVLGGCDVPRGSYRLVQGVAG